MDEKLFSLFTAKDFFVHRLESERCHVSLTLKSDAMQTSSSQQKAEEM